MIADFRNQKGEYEATKNKKNYRSFYQLVVKRFVDIVVSIIAIPFFFLLSIPIAIAIKLDDGGPIFYHDHRMGKDNKEFVMLKFRSMTVNAPMIVNKDGSTYNADDDPRVTKVGHFLRKTSMDELPQLLNVFVGQMSLVGPRASGWDAMGTFLEDEADKMKVRPGITGLTQAYFRNSVSPRVKRVWDAWYAHNVTMWMDIRILFKTVVTVFKKENLYTEEGTEDQSTLAKQETVGEKV